MFPGLFQLLNSTLAREKQDRANCVNRVNHTIPAQVCAGTASGSIEIR